MKKYSQIINTIFIILGGGILMYSISGEEKNRYLQIIGLIIIMFGLYRATHYWVETKDDDKNPEVEKIEEKKEDKSKKKI